MTEKETKAAATGGKKEKGASPTLSRKERQALAKEHAIATGDPREVERRQGHRIRPRRQRG